MIDSESFGNYDLVKKIKLDFTDVVISKWRSRVTGLTVVHLDYDGIVVPFQFFKVTNFLYDYSTNYQWLFHGRYRELANSLANISFLLTDY